MKTLLFGLLSLQLTLIGNETYGTQKEAQNSSNGHSQKKLPRSMSTLNLPSKDLEIIDELRPKIDEDKRNEEQNQYNELNEYYMQFLQQRFESTQDNGIIEIDISYPSFLNSISRFCERRPIPELQNYIVSLITAERGNKIDADDIFNQLFEVEPQDEDFEKKIRSEFKILIKNITFWQRVKTLLILRKITDCNLCLPYIIFRGEPCLILPPKEEKREMGIFTPRPLPVIKLKKGEESHLKDEGFNFTIELNTKPLDFLLINSKNSSSSTSEMSVPNMLETTLVHEMSHLYHLIMLENVSSRKMFPLFSPIRELSWTFDDNIRLLNPLACKKIRDNVVDSIARVLIEYYKDKKYKISDDVRNDIRKISEDYVKKIDHLCENAWTNLEEVLTIIGIAPIDIENNGNVTRYRIIDRQNQSAELNRHAGVYRLLHNTSPFTSKTLPDKDQNSEELKDEEKIQLKALNKKIAVAISEAFNSSGYNLYQGENDVEKNSPAMKEAEDDFLKKFNAKTINDHQTRTTSIPVKIETLKSSLTKVEIPQEKSEKEISEINKLRKNLTRALEDFQASAPDDQTTTTSTKSVNKSVNSKVPYGQEILPKEPAR